MKKLSQLLVAISMVAIGVLPVSASAQVSSVAGAGAEATVIVGGDDRPDR